MKAPGRPHSAREIGRLLVDWYDSARRDLPWRRTSDPYRIWLSEIMLQQTRVETVVPYYERFLARFPTVEALAAANDDEVLALWSGLGYYRRARSLLAGARVLAARHEGRFPRALEQALEIPGVGPYTAAAVLSIAYGEPLPVLDGNVERVLTRVQRRSDNPRSAAVKRELRELAASWMPADRAGDFNQAMMELGATTCTPLAPACERCPLAAHCEAASHGDPESYPRLPKRRETVPVEIEVGVVREGDRYLLERVTESSFLDGLWLFPLAETTNGGERIEGVLSRKLQVPVRAGERLPPVRHSITFRRITLRPRSLDASGVDISGRPNFRWARLDELGDTVPVSSICLKLAARLERRGSSES